MRLRLFALAIVLAASIAPGIRALTSDFSDDEPASESLPKRSRFKKFSSGLKSFGKGRRSRTAISEEAEDRLGTKSARSTFSGDTLGTKSTRSKYRLDAVDAKSTRSTYGADTLGATKSGRFGGILKSRSWRKKSQGAADSSSDSSSDDPEGSRSTKSTFKFGRLGRLGRRSRYRKHDSEPISGVGGTQNVAAKSHRHWKRDDPDSTLDEPTSTEKGLSKKWKTKDSDRILDELSAVEEGHSKQGDPLESLKGSQVESSLSKPGASEARTSELKRGKLPNKFGSAADEESEAASDAGDSSIIKGSSDKGNFLARKFRQGTSAASLYPKETDKETALAKLEEEGETESVDVGVDLDTPSSTTPAQVVMPLPELVTDQEPISRNAYVSVLYVGTSRDYEYYIGLRVTMQSIKKTGTTADLVAITSPHTPTRWIDVLSSEGLRVIRAPNLGNPYNATVAYNPRFRFVLNKLLAWLLTEYTRVVLLDADNLVLKNTDELFLCGEFCAVFINPCIFHTGLVVLKPAKKTYRSMMRQMASLPSFDAGDQGFLASYYPSLLSSPLFKPPSNATAALVAARLLQPVRGLYRLPMGYQMDAVYFNLKFKWHVPCSDNKVVTFPGVSALKPWYWWAWPVLPLGLQWHTWRLSTIGYAWESPVCMSHGLLWVAIIVGSKIRTIIAMLLRSDTGSSSAGAPKTSACFMWIRGIVLPRAAANGLQAANLLRKWLIAATVPTAGLLSFSLIPPTSHPLVAWPLLILGMTAMLRVVRIILGAPRAVYWLPFYVAASVMVIGLPIYSALAFKLVVFFVLAFGGGIVSVLSFQNIFASEWGRTSRAGQERSE